MMFQKASPRCTQYRCTRKRCEYAPGQLLMDWVILRMVRGARVDLTWENVQVEPVMRDLLEIMWQRHSSRAPFDTKRKIREQDLQRILDAARWSPTAHNLQNFEIIVIDDAHKLTEISALQLPPSETFEVDNFRQLSFSEAELLRTKTGLLASMFPASWHERDVEPEADNGARLTYFGRTISACPVLLVVIYDIRLRLCEGHTLDIMSLGCVMQNLWLMSESLGISLQILSAVSENEVQNRLRRILAMPAHMNIAFAVRLGYAITASESHLRVRRRIQEFTHRNRYADREPE
jgi:nitroreductase